MRSKNGLSRPLTTTASVLSSARPCPLPRSKSANVTAANVVVLVMGFLPLCFGSTSSRSGEIILLQWSHPNQRSRLLELSGLVVLPPLAMVGGDGIGGRQYGAGVGRKAKRSDAK